MVGVIEGSLLISSVTKENSNKLYTYIYREEKRSEEKGGNPNGNGEWDDTRLNGIWKSGINPVMAFACSFWEREGRRERERERGRERGWSWCSCGVYTI